MGDPEHRQRQVRDLASVGASDRDICEYLEISEAELRQHAAILVQARAARRIALLKRQTLEAIDGSTGMLSLLGKHELGQTHSPPADNDWPEPQLDPKVG